MLQYSLKYREIIIAMKTYEFNKGHIDPDYIVRSRSGIVRASFTIDRFYPGNVES